MAVYNVPNYLAKDGFSMPLNIRRGNPNPLDNSSVWSSLTAAQNYAKTDPVAYVGQILTVVTQTEVDDVTVTTATAYVIDNEAGDLKAVGSSPVGDEKSITVDPNGTVSLYGISGLTLTREVEKDGETVTEKITYQPLLVDGKLTWVEPSATTVEGLASEIEALKTRAGTIESIIGKASEGETEATGLYKSIEDNVAAIEAETKAREESVESFTEAIENIINTIGDIEEGKTLVGLIADSVYDDTEINGRVETIETKYVKKTDIPTVISAFTNDSKYQTDTEVQATVQAAIAEINHAVFEKVDAVPTVEDAVSNVLYLVPNEDKLDIFAKINNEMVLIDDTDADLSGYAKTEDLHEHLNKSLLDTYDQTNEDIKDAVDKKHSHTFVDTDVEDAITKKHAHENATVLDGITAEKVAAWDAAEQNIINSVDETQFVIDENKKLSLLDISIDKVTGLSDTLKNYVEKGEYLSDYGITDAYTKTETENLVDEKILDFSTDFAGIKEQITESIETINTKLDTIEENAQVNVLEAIQINGVAQAITDKAVNIPVATDSLLGVVKSSVDENKVVVNTDGTMEVNNININKIVQDEGTTIVLNGGNAGLTVNN